MDRVCPLLGLASDRRTAVNGVDSAHRCHAETTPIPLEQRVQAQLCLTATHVRCERYVAHQARSGRPSATIFGDGFVTTRMVITPEPVWRGIAGRARRAPRRRVLAGALVVGAVGVTGAAVTAAGLDGRLEIAFGSASHEAVAVAPSSSTPIDPPGPSASPVASAVASIRSPTLVPSASPTSPTPAAVATPAPTAPPATVAPPPQATYAVQDGDTLALIAQRFGTSVEALQAANGLDDPDEIVIGDLLVIP